MKLNELMIGILLTILILPFINAHELSQDPGTTPDSFLWGLDKAIDQISILLAGSPDAKATKGLEIAHERLLEVKAMIEENKLESASKAERAHEGVLLKVKEKIKDIEDSDPEEEIKKELEIEKELKEHEEEIEELETKLKIKIEIKGTLTAEQQAKLGEFLKSLVDNTDAAKIEIKNEKEKTKIKIKQETGKTDEEIEDEIEELEEELGILEQEIEVKARIIGNVTVIKIENEFETRTIDKDALVDEIINKFKLDNNTTSSILDLKTEEEEEEFEEDKLKIKAEIEDDISEVEIKLRFTLNSTSRDDIITAIISRTKLTKDDVLNNLKLKIEEEEEEKETEIEVEIENNISKVEIEIDNSELEFTLNTTDKELILQEIASRLNLSVQEIRPFVDFEFEDDDFKDDDEDNNEESESGKNNNSNNNEDFMAK